MEFYKPGAFKNKLLNITVESDEKKEEVKNEIKEEKEEKYLVKPVEILENVVWKKIKTGDEVKKQEEEVKPIKYVRRDIYLRKMEYKNFLEKEWDNLWDMYDKMINYSIIFLDKARDSDNNRAFYDFTKLVFNNLKIYE